MVRLCWRAATIDVHQQPEALCLSAGLPYVETPAALSVLMVAAPQVTLESAEQLLRSVVFAQWQASQCESYEDTLKFMSMIDIFMPYLPLERQHMPQLVELALRDRAALLKQQRVTLTWAPEVTTYIAAQVCAPE